MALNLIKATTRGGEAIYIGVAQIVAILSNTDGCKVLVSGDPSSYDLRDQASEIFERANRRPPDGQ